jgi:predicted metal-dependent HD superfamily phosphohydrolase
MAWEYPFKRWGQLCSIYSGNKELIQELFDEIVKKYSSPERYYHTLRHIEALLKLSDDYSVHLADKGVIDFSIFYHDIIYNIPAVNNEGKSAALAVRRLQQLGVPYECTDRISLFIEATKDHKLKKVSNLSDLKYFLDFDLAVLGSEKNVYEEYALQVRKEYRIYPDILYYTGRRKFLSASLAQKHIYFTDEFRSRYEEHARRNMANELNSKA